MLGDEPDWAETTVVVSVDLGGPEPVVAVVGDWPVMVF
jgi:hypothetical protein